MPRKNKRAELVNQIYLDAACQLIQLDSSASEEEDEIIDNVAADIHAVIKFIITYYILHTKPFILS
jgi:hypothetical protein